MKLISKSNGYKSTSYRTVFSHFLTLDNKKL